MLQTHGAHDFSTDPVDKMPPQPEKIAALPHGSKTSNRSLKASEALGPVTNFAFRVQGCLHQPEFLPNKVASKCQPQAGS